MRKTDSLGLSVELRDVFSSVGLRFIDFVELEVLFIVVPFSRDISAEGEVVEGLLGLLIFLGSLLLLGGLLLLSGLQDLLGLLDLQSSEPREGGPLLGWVTALGKPFSVELRLDEDGAQGGVRNLLEIGLQVLFFLPLWNFLRVGVFDWGEFLHSVNLEKPESFSLDQSPRIEDEFLELESVLSLQLLLGDVDSLFSFNLRWDIVGDLLDSQMIGQPFVLSVDESTDKVSSHSEVGDEGVLVDLVIRSDFGVLDYSWGSSLHDNSSGLLAWSTGDVLGNEVKLVRLSLNSLKHTDHEWVAGLGQEVVDSDEVEVFDSELGPLFNESVSLNSLIDTSVSISRHGQLEFAVHENVASEVKGWELSLLEKVDILLPKSEV